MTSSARQRQQPEFDVEANMRDVVRVLLALNHMTAQDLGRQMGLSKSAIGTRMTGESRFTVGEVYRMARIFGVSVETMYRPPALEGAKTNRGENALPLTTAA